jgi:putative CocE/NonD family hydrolase
LFRIRAFPALLLASLVLPISSLALPVAAQSASESTASAEPRLGLLAGEYTNPGEPDSPLSFYVQNGALVVESDRLVPTPLTALSAVDFALPDSGGTLQFTLAGDGRGESVALLGEAKAVYRRTGPPEHHVFHDYRRSGVMIPMRDGVKLHAVVLKPADIATPLPILMQRTPYGAYDTTRASFFASRPELARAGYIYVVEDIRGRYKSQGKFVMMRPLADHANPKAIDESTDAWDTVAWLIKHISGNNGRVGVVGTSYPGFLATMAGIDPNPAVKAISPQAPMIDVWIGDDFFHNGAFRQSYGYDYVLSMESSKRFTSDSYGKTPDGKPMDGYDFFLQRGSFLQDVKHSGSRMLPTWKLFLNHPAYDSVWSSRGVEHHLNTVAVPTLDVGGYYDQEDMWGPQEVYKKLEPHDAGHDLFFAEGPWRHGYWSSSSIRLGNLDYGRPIGSEFRSQIEAEFFAHYLKGDCRNNQFCPAPAGFGHGLAAVSERTVFSFETGSNAWEYYEKFPPGDAHTTSLHLGSHGVLSWSTPAAATTTYVSDPGNPVPYRHRPIQPTYGPGSQWYNWLSEDQRFVTGRKDVAVWTLPVLKHDLTLTGEVTADIYAATTGSDNDMVVKLIDEYPQNDPDAKMRGYQLMTNAEIFRGRYLSGIDHPTALAPNSVHEYKFSLHDVDHVFKAGHTVMVEIQSTWFPLYDRNPQTFVPNIMKAQAQDYKAETITIESGPGQDSTLQVPVVSSCGQPFCD